MHSALRRSTAPKLKGPTSLPRATLLSREEKPRESAAVGGMRAHESRPEEKGRKISRERGGAPGSGHAGEEGGLARDWRGAASSRRRPRACAALRRAVSPVRVYACVSRGQRSRPAATRRPRTAAQGKRARGQRRAACRSGRIAERRPGFGLTPPPGRGAGACGRRRRRRRPAGGLTPRSAVRSRARPRRPGME